MAEPENLDCLDQALDDMDNKLNLTADEKDNGLLANNPYIKQSIFK